MKNQYKREKRIITITTVIMVILNIVFVVAFWKNIKFTGCSLLALLFMIVSLLKIITTIHYKRTDFLSPSITTARSNYEVLVRDTYFPHFTQEYAKDFYLILGIDCVSVTAYIPFIFFGNGYWFLIVFFTSALLNIIMLICSENKEIKKKKEEQKKILDELKEQKLKEELGRYK